MSTIPPRVQLIASLVFTVTLCTGLYAVVPVIGFSASLIALVGLTSWYYKKLSNNVPTTHYQLLAERGLPYIHTDGDGNVLEISQLISPLLDLNDASAQQTLAQLLPQKATPLLEKNFQTTEICLNQTADVRWLKIERLDAINGYLFLLRETTAERELKALSVRDPLTGLKNQRGFEQDVDEMIKRAKRLDQHFTLAVIDVDTFSDYNQTFGHDEGDKALQVLADCLRKTLRRATDHLYRIGGDEFVAVFEGDTPNVCRRALTNVITEFENKALPSTSPEIAPFLTVSAGAYGAKGADLSDSEQLYMNADIQLYNAKETQNTLRSLFTEETAEQHVKPLAARLSESS